MVNITLTRTKHADVRDDVSSSSDSKKGIRRLFTRTDATQDMRPAFIPQVDFSDLYTDWQLDEEVEAFKKENPEKYDSIVDRLDTWFADHKWKCFRLMFNNFGHELIDFKTFKQVLIDLNVPASEFERHLLCLLFDFGYKKCISLRNFEQSLLDHYRADMEAQHRNVIPQDLVEENLYIRMNLMSHTHIEAMKFRGNFRVLVMNDMYVGALVDIIHERLPLIYRDFDFYTSLTSIRSKEDPLPHNLTLLEAGLKGGPLHQPTEHFIFYIMNFPYPCSSLLMYRHHETEKRDKQRKMMEMARRPTGTNWWEKKKK